MERWESDIVESSAVAVFRIEPEFKAARESFISERMSHAAAELAGNSASRGIGYPENTNRAHPHSMTTRPEENRAPLNRRQLRNRRFSVDGATVALVYHRRFAT